MNELEEQSRRIREALETLPAWQRLANAEHFTQLSRMMHESSVNITSMGILTYDDVCALARYGKD